MASVILLVASCGGDEGATGPDPDPPKPPPPVATVAISPLAGSLVEQESVQLTATLRDASGNVLTGRSVVWTTDHPAVATVSQSGLVTALAEGTTTISATSEGRTGTATIAVTGTLIGPGGGQVSGGDGVVTLTFPPAALPSETEVRIERATSTPPLPPAIWSAGQGAWKLSPDGASFAQPVTVTLRYDRATLPRWVMTGDLGIHRWDGSAWHALTDVVVDTVAATISGRTPGFSTVSIVAQTPGVGFALEEASVNEDQRTVSLVATVEPRGDPLYDSYRGAFFFTWSTTGIHGVLHEETTSDDTVGEAFYTATEVDLPKGVIDRVTVVVRTFNIETGQIDSLGAATIDIEANLEWIVRLLPSSSQVEPGQARLLAAQLLRNGREVSTAGYAFAWEETGLHGSITHPERSNGPDAQYRAFPISVFPPPRVDRVVVRAITLTFVETRNGLNGPEYKAVPVELGAGEAFIEVPVTYDAELSPAAATIKSGEAVTLQATVTPIFPGTGLKYRYSTGGSQGTITPTGVSSSSTVEYTASVFGKGADWVRVEVLDVAEQLLATAMATITVERPPAIDIEGSWITVTNLYEDGIMNRPASCVMAYATFPVIEGATRYEVRISGRDPERFPDPVWETTVTWPLEEFVLCNRFRIGGQNGVIDGEYRLLIGAFTGFPPDRVPEHLAQLQAWFASVVVDERVHFD